MKPGTIRMASRKLFRSFYGTNKLMALSVLFFVQPDTSGEHLKPSNTKRYSRGSKFGSRRCAPSGILDILGLALSVLRLTLLYIWQFWSKLFLLVYSTQKPENFGCDFPGSL